MFKQLIFDVKCLHAKMVWSSIKCTTAKIYIYFRKTVSKRLSLLRLSPVNNTAPNGDRARAPHLRGNQIYGVFLPTMTDRIPIFSSKILKKRLKYFVFRGRLPSNLGLDAQFLNKNVWSTEILIPSHDKMAAVDSFGTKSFFLSFPDR